MKDFDVIFDTGRITTFVGNSYFNQGLKTYMGRYGKTTELVTIEHALEQNQQWFDDRQFFTTVSSIAFRKNIVDSLQPFNPNWITVVGTNTVDPFYDLNQLGKGVFLYGHNYVTDDSVSIGNYSIITGACVSHGTKVGNFCYLSPWCYSSYTTLGDGTCLGTGTYLFGRRDNQLEITNWCNIVAGSRVTKNILYPGTYLNNKTINSQSSMENHIL